MTRAWWIALLLLVAPASAQGQAGTFQGGPAHDGNATNAGVSGPLRKAWSHRATGGFSYPVIGHGRVYALVRLTPPDTSPYPYELRALSVRSGRVLWRRDLGRSFSAELAYDDGRVFVVQKPFGDAGAVLAFDEAGRQLWQAAPGAAGYGPPVADRGAVFTHLEESVVALAQDDGRVLWSATVGGTSFSGPAVAADAVYLTEPCSRTFALRRSDGAALWTAPGECDGGGDSTPVLAGGRVYGYHPGFRASGAVHDAATGRLLAVEHSARAPAFARGVGLFSDARRPGETMSFGHVLRATDLSSGRVRWRFAGDGYLDSPPLIAGSTAYVGSGSGRLYGLDLRTGQRVWRTNVRAPVTTVGMAAAEGVLVVPAYGRLVAFRSR